jgi:hypothetical protein
VFLTFRKEGHENPITRTQQLCCVVGPHLTLPFPLGCRKRTPDKEGSCSSGQPIKGGPQAWGLRVGLTTPHRHKISLLRNVTNMTQKRRRRLVGHVARVGEKRNAFSSVSQPPGPRLRGKRIYRTAV